MKLNANELVAIEQTIDRCGLANVMRALRDICDEKATHVETNWQDAELASRWNDAAIACANMAERPAITRVSE